MLGSGVLGMIVLFVPFGLMAQHQHVSDGQRTEIPRSLQEEHHALHSELEAGMKRTDAIGVAVRDLARVLHPHFVREEQIALPPLGALQTLARGDQPADAERLAAMTDSLAREMPRMLEEHRAIAAAVSRLHDAAAAARDEQWIRFARKLRLHALSEEEVNYPAALLVGKLLGHARHH